MSAVAHSRGIGFYAYPEIMVPWQLDAGAIWHGWTLECPRSVEAGSSCSVDAILKSVSDVMRLCLHVSEVTDHSW